MNEFKKLKRNLVEFCSIIIEHLDSGESEKAREVAMDIMVYCEGIGEA